MYLEEIKVKNTLNEPQLDMWGKTEQKNLERKGQKNLNSQICLQAVVDLV